LQTIASRESALTKILGVISLGQIQRRVSNKIFSAECTKLGTKPTLDSGMQKDLHKKFINTAKKLQTLLQPKQPWFLKQSPANK
jgi:hypothetical protein